MTKSDEAPTPRNAYLTDLAAARLLLAGLPAPTPRDVADAAGFAASVFGDPDAPIPAFRSQAYRYASQDLAEVALRVAPNAVAFVVRGINGMICEDAPAGGQAEVVALFLRRAAANALGAEATNDSHDAAAVLRAFAVVVHAARNDPPQD